MGIMLENVNLCVPSKSGLYYFCLDLRVTFCAFDNRFLLRRNNNVLRLLLCNNTNANIVFLAHFFIVFDLLLVLALVFLAIEEVLG
jgi:hypothetical protein